MEDPVSRPPELPSKLDDSRQILSCSYLMATDPFILSVDASQSSTFAEVAPGGFNIVYGDGSSKTGDYISDNLEVGGVTIQGLEMGLALGGNAGDAWGIMGVGFDATEETATKYPNIIDDMVSQGLIDSAFYSLWLDDIRKSNIPRSSSLRNNAVSQSVNC